MSGAGQGRFISFEGGEGAGKSTQIRRLGAHLRTYGVDVVMTREPGGSPKAEAIREHLLAGHARDLGAMGEALLFSAARLDHIDTLIRPSLNRGAWVLCDRFSDSTRAYQGSLGELDDGLLQALERIVIGKLKPDLTLILDLPPQIGLQRAALRRGSQSAPDRFEAEGIAFHARLREAFRQIAAREPGRCALIDAEGSEDEVARSIIEVVHGRFDDLLGPVQPVMTADAHGRAARNG